MPASSSKCWQLSQVTTSIEVRSRGRDCEESVTRPFHEYDTVRELVASGMNDCAISRQTGVPRTTVRDWRRGGEPGAKAVDRRRQFDATCPLCGDVELDHGWYAYLLGLYLGDGCLSEQARNVFKLRITLDLKYPEIIGECGLAIAQVRKSSDQKIGRVPKIGCVEITSYWKHWPCLFPQHGEGRKHLRKIELVPWQQEIVDGYPARLLRGLIHSDGCRGLNRVSGKGYPYYMFTNHSDGIRDIFCRACDVYGVHWRKSSWKTIAISRAADVAKLDLEIGPKT